MRNMTTQRRKLIEVDLPLDAINAESAREKSIRHGHPSTLHLWWARRPLAACRAVLFASMVDDPADCPEEFPTEAAQHAERERLHEIIRQMVKWENTDESNPAAKQLVEQARCEIARSVARSRGEIAPAAPAAVLRYLNDYARPVYDPFAGGGSIPLEAQRLGLRAVASDLNPVAVLINKALIEIPPKFTSSPPVNPDADRLGLAAGQGQPPWRGAAGLADDIRYYGRWMREEAFARIGHLYPRVKLADGTDATVIAWLWARTVPCPNPACRLNMPLMATFQLSKKKGNEHWIRPVVDREKSRVSFVVQSHSTGVPASGTVNRNGATCLGCGTAVKLPYVREQGRAGQMGEQMTAIVAAGNRKRLFLSPTKEHVKAAQEAEPAWRPNGELPERARSISTQIYGFTEWHKLFTARQLTALTTFSDLLAAARKRIYGDMVAARTDDPLGVRTSRPQQDDTTWQARRLPSQGEDTCEAQTDAPLGVRTSRPQQDDTAWQARRLPSQGEDTCEAQTDAPLGVRTSRPQQGDEPVWHSRGRLPHFEAGETPQSITFRLHDSLPAPLRAQWELELKSLPESDWALERRKRVEAALDRGLGACYLQDPRIAQRVEDALKHFDSVKYHLHAWCIMPNHVHVIVTPLSGWTLSSILHSWKSFTGHKANALLGRKGSFWMEEYFDRAIRDENHFMRAVEYIENNPVKAGLCGEAAEWEWSSAGAAQWQARRLPSQGEDAYGAQTNDPLEATEREWSSAGAAQWQARRLPSEGEDTCGVQTNDPLGGRTSRPQQDDLSPEDAEAKEYAEAVCTYLALAVGRTANRGSSFTFWDALREIVVQVFGRQGIAMVWDFAEGNPFSTSTGNWIGQCEYVSKVIDHLPADVNAGLAHQADASTTIHAQNGPIIVTDPPYYDNIHYADSSDFFYVWLRPLLRDTYPDLFAGILTPKTEEMVANRFRFENYSQRFEEQLSKTLRLIRERCSAEFPSSIFYAYKQQEEERAGRASTGWETMLNAIVQAGFEIVGTWPMRTELTTNLKKNINALASSVVLVCRPRPADAPLATRRQFLDALAKELPNALDQLTQKGHIAPTDLAQAAIGPGMQIYSRYRGVETIGGEPVTVREALAAINHAIAEYDEQQEGDLDAESRFCLDWLKQHGYGTGPYGQAETLARAKNVSMGKLQHSDGLLTTAAGSVQLLPIDAYSADRPLSLGSPTAWEGCCRMAFHLNREEGGGIRGAAQIARAMDGRVDAVERLARILYNHYDRQSDAPNAVVFNNLVTAWQSIQEQMQMPEELGLFGK